MLCFRASLAFVLSAALAASPVFAAKAHHARTSGHASVSSHTSTSSSTSKRASSRSRHASADQSASDRTSSRRHGRHASSRAASNSTSEPASVSRRHARHGSHSVAAVAAPHRSHGQQAIDSARVTEIQQALIREHYFTGEANGQWDDATRSAMLKYQADQGWQTKLMPDSRALKKLGLGPDYSKAINAKDSSFADSPRAGTTSPSQSSGFASAAGVNQ